MAHSHPVRERPSRHVSHAARSASGGKCNNRVEPDYRHVKNQHFCGKPECRKASHRHSQHKWLRKNPAKYSGNAHCLRIPPTSG